MSTEGTGSEALERTPRRAKLGRNAVRNYILENPAVVLDDAEVSAKLVELAGQRYGSNVVSLQTAVMARMRERLRAVEIEREEMLDAAEANLVSMNQVNDAILHMLEAPSFQDFIDIVGSQFGELLVVDSVRLCVETPPAKDADRAGDIGTLCPIAPGSVNAFFHGAPWGVSLRAVEDPTRALHTDGDIESEALVRLDFGPGSQPGVLLFGARDSDRFHEEQGGDLLVFLGGAVSRVMRHWLDEPEVV